MIIKKIILLTTLILSCSLSSCSFNNTEKELIDIDQMTDSSNQVSISDTRRNFFGTSRLVTTDGQFLYSATGIRVDLGNKIIEKDCDIVGCDHWSETCEASPQTLKDICFILCDNGGKYTNANSKIYYEKDGKKELIYQNTYSTKESEEAKQDSMILNFIPYDDNKFIVGGFNYVYILDTKTKEASQPIVVGNSFMTNISVVDKNTLVAANVNMELFLIHLDTQNVEKLRDYVTDVQTDGGYLYFIDKYQQKNDLIKFDLATSSETVMTEDVSLFCVYNNGIIFGKGITLDDGTEITTQLYMIDTESSEPESIYKIDSEKSGENGRIQCLYYFPGYSKLIISVVTDRPDTQDGDYVLLGLNDWKEEYIMNNISNHK